MEKKTFSSRFPLESFDERYRNIWLKACISEVHITFPDVRSAQTFQARLHMYRSKLRKSGDSLGEKLYRAKTSREGNILHIRPADAQFESILENFSKMEHAPASPGTTPPAPEHLDASNATPLPSTNISIDDLFAEFNLEED